MNGSLSCRRILPRAFVPRFIGFVTVIASVLLIANVAVSTASQIWTDGDGDGLPDASEPIVTGGDSEITVDIWIDAGTFLWTNYAAWLAWPSACMELVSTEYLISGGTNTPPIILPYGAGLSGYGFDEGGIDRLGRMTLRLETPGVCCVVPAIDPGGAYVSFVDNRGTYQLFDTRSGTCAQPLTESCCFLDGTCVDALLGQCPPQSFPQGNGSSCGFFACDNLVGACCFANGTCAEAMSIGECFNSGGVFQGPDTSCNDVACPDLTGACCAGDGSCTDRRTEDECEDMAGTFQGEGTACDEVACPDPTLEACCDPRNGSCVEAPLGQCPQGTIGRGAGTRCATTTCEIQAGACCVGIGCVPDLTPGQCAARDGRFQGIGSTCDPDPCVQPCIPGLAATARLLRESSGPERGGAGCPLATSTDGSAANYRWYNVCSGYIWIYSVGVFGEGVGVLFGGPTQPEVNGDNRVKRVITYWRNIVVGYSQTVDVYLDQDREGDGCPDGVLATDLNLDPGLRWNCSEMNVEIPCGIEHVITRCQSHGGAAPTFATDGPFSQECDPNSPARSFYYGLNASQCVPWCGPGGGADNFLYWVILDVSEPCVTATVNTSWGKIKALFR